ncbi:SpnB-like Rossmann fold domain-containing protein, partial [Streptomyces mobaraensis]|uniref:SpnB-like Rossmann fold domain-containing protein n=1 Tax=Streptomyces mobaraensis TaxID=35621 RepID=UPI0013E0C8CD
VHPAVLDAALHAVGLTGVGERAGLPFAWSGVELYATGASALRVRVSPRGEGAVALEVADATGRPVASVERLDVRPISEEQLAQARAEYHESLYRVDWVPAVTSAAVSESAGVVVDFAELAGVSGEPDVVVLRAFGGGVPDVPGDVSAVLERVLSAVQAWLEDERCARSRLVVVTRGAVPADGAEVTDLAGAAVGGLVRSAQAEHPDRIVLLDLDVDGASVPSEALHRALATREPQLALRDGALYTPRLVRAAVPAAAETLGSTDGTVLVTGGLSGLGAVVARWLVVVCGVRRLV